jgi:hypothetical protein
MRYKAMFLAGVAAGYVLGARAGRERYDQLVKVTKQVAGHPAVQKAAGTVQAKTSDLAKSAAAKAPDLARRAPDLAKSAVSQVPGLVSTAREQAASRLPFGGKDGAPGEAGGSQIPRRPGDTSAYNGTSSTADYGSTAG